MVGDQNGISLLFKTAEILILELVTYVPILRKKILWAATGIRMDVGNAIVTMASR